MFGINIGIVSKTSATGRFKRHGYSIQWHACTVHSAIFHNNYGWVLLLLARAKQIKNISPVTVTDIRKEVQSLALPKTTG
jgi:hypothetical protein